MAAASFMPFLRPLPLPRVAYIRLYRRRLSTQPHLHQDGIELWRRGDRAYFANIPMIYSIDHFRQCCAISRKLDTSSTTGPESTTTTRLPRPSYSLTTVTYLPSR